MGAGERALPHGDLRVKAMVAHFDLRRDGMGWTVFDRWTGATVVIGWIPQIGLSLVNAEELVRTLNARGDGQRKILQ